MKRIKFNNDGFTLAEVLAVLVIITVMSFVIFLAISATHFILKCW